RCPPASAAGAARARPRSLQGGERRGRRGKLASLRHPRLLTMRETRQCVRDLPAAHGGIVRRGDDDEVLVHVPGCLGYPVPSPHSALLALSAPRKARLRRRTTANVYAHGAADVVV